ncbi:MAG: hypothetical protein VKP57_11815 [Candidatus Sericytochromatia bacterium]|nr:hypothetical protein [Candidatus Sericytochromatia bacterium]
MFKRLMVPMLPLAVACAANTTSGTGAVKGSADQAAQDAMTRALVSQPDPEGVWTGRVTVPSKIRGEAGIGVMTNGSGALIANMAGGLVSNNAGIRRVLAAVATSSPAPSTEGELPVASASVEVITDDGTVLMGLTDDKGYYSIPVGSRKPVELRSRFQLGERPITLNTLPFRKAAQPLSFATTLATAGFRKKFGADTTLGASSLETFQQLTQDLEAQALQAQIDAMRSFEQAAKALEEIQKENAALMERINSLNASMLEFPIPTPMPWVFDNWTPTPVAFPTFPPMDIPTPPPMDFPTPPPVDFPTPPPMVTPAPPTVPGF